MKALKLSFLLIMLQLFVFPQNNPWQKLNIESPPARSYATLVEIDSSYYLYGGESQDKSPEINQNKSKNFLNDLWVYTSEVNWELKNPTGDLPQGRRYHASTQKDGKLYVFGGEIEAGTTTDCWEYDPEGNTWYQLPFGGENPKHFHRACTGENKIWITGGLDLTTGSATGAIWGYDPLNQIWTQGSDCPSPRYGHIAYCFDGKVNIIAGRQGDNLLDDAWEYDITFDTWTQKSIPPYPEPTKFAGFDNMDDKLYTAGGYIKSEGNYELSSEAYTFDEIDFNWRTHSPVPPSISEVGICLRREMMEDWTLDFKVFVYGIADNGKGSYVGETWVYHSADDPLTDVSDTFKNDNIVVHPTITNGKVHITSEIFFQEVEVHNIQGKLIQTNKLNGNKCTIDLNGNMKGIYFVKVKQNNRYSTHKLILTQ